MASPVLSTLVDNTNQTTTMSTPVDKKPRRERVSSEQTRARILKAASLAFCRASYDAVGVREIAQNADVDPAMVPRLFGSKEALFRQIADEAFSLEPAFAGPVEGLGHRVAAHLLGPIRKSEPDSFDEFAFLLSSVGSPVGAPILSEALHAQFVIPLANRLGGKNAAFRAAMVTSYVMGFAVMRAALNSPSLDSTPPSLVTERLGRAIQDCLDA
jgi:AcrR family transcriptional regulator